VFSQDVTKAVERTAQRLTCIAVKTNATAAEEIAQKLPSMEGEKCRRNVHTNRDNKKL
jgi:hypothetical protein